MLSTARSTCPPHFFDNSTSLYSCAWTLCRYARTTRVSIHKFLRFPNLAVNFCYFSPFYSFIPIIPMSTPRDERYYNSLGKSRRGTPVAESQGSLFFQGQGGRTVLPPISSAFPNSLFPGLFFFQYSSLPSAQFVCTVPVSYSNQYTQPRSSPRYDYPAVYNQWPSNHPSEFHVPFIFNTHIPVISVFLTAIVLHIL